MTVNGNEIVLLVSLKNSAGRPSGPALPFRFKALLYLLISAGVKKTGGTAEVVN